MSELVATKRQDMFFSNVGNGEYGNFSVIHDSHGNDGLCAAYRVYFNKDDETSRRAMHELLLSLRETMNKLGVEWPR